MFRPDLPSMLEQFLSTPSARRATDVYEVTDVCEIISIHALREEGDGRRTSSERAE